MAGYKYERFIGEFPQRSRRHLEPNAAVVARDMRLGSGEIRTLTSPVPIYSFRTPGPGAQAYQVYVEGLVGSTSGGRTASHTGALEVNIPSPEVAPSDEAVAITPAAQHTAATSLLDVYQEVNAQGGEYAIERRRDQGSLLWARDKTLVFEFYSNPWQVDDDNFVGSDAQKVEVTGRKELGDGVASVFALTMTLNPKTGVAGDYKGKYSVAVSLNTEYTWDEVYPSATEADDPWAKDNANRVIPGSGFTVDFPSDLAARHSLSFVLIPRQGGAAMVLQAYLGTALVWEHKDRTGRVVEVPTALMPDYLDVVLKGRGVDTSLSAQGGTFGVVPNASATFTAPPPTGFYPPAADRVGPFDLPSRYEGVNTRRYLLDATDFSYSLFGDARADFFSDRRAFPNDKLPPGDVGRRFSYTHDFSGKNPIYEAYSAFMHGQLSEDGLIDPATSEFGDVGTASGSGIVPPGHSNEMTTYQFVVTDYLDSLGNVGFEKLVFTWRDTGWDPINEVQVDWWVKVELRQNASGDADAYVSHQRTVDGVVVVSTSPTGGDSGTAAVASSDGELFVSIISRGGGSWFQDLVYARVPGVGDLPTSFADPGAVFPDPGVKGRTPFVGVYVEAYPASSASYFTPNEAVSPVITMNTFRREMDLDALSDFSEHHILGVEDWMFYGLEVKRLEAEDNARTIVRLDIEPDGGEEVPFWVRILPETDFLGESVDEDVHGRLYWASEDIGVRVSTLNELYAESAAAVSSPTRGYPVGVPSGDELFTSFDAVPVAPEGEQYPITHAGVLKVPAFTATVREGELIDNNFRYDEGGQLVKTSPRTMSYPETYYFLVRTSKPDARRPLSHNRAVVLRNEWLTGKGPAEWANAARHSQMEAFHYYPRNEDDPSEASLGVKLVKAVSTEFDGFPDDTFLAHSIRATQAHPLDPAIPLFAGTLAATAYPSTTGVAAPVRDFFRTTQDDAFPANWRFVADRADVGTKTEDRITTTFAPVLITDPTKVFNRLWKNQFTRVNRERRTSPTSFYVRSNGGQEYDTLVTEEWLRSFWVFQVDAATFASLKTTSTMPELLPGTHFEQAKPIEPWFGDELFRRKKASETHPQNKGTTFGRVYSRAQGEMPVPGSYEPYQPEAWTTGPLLMDASQPIDWGHLEITTSSYLAFDTPFVTPGSFDAATAARGTRDIALVPVNGYGEEGPPSFQSVEYFSDFPFAPVDIELSFNRMLAGKYRLKGYNIYRLEDDGVYYLLRENLLPDDLTTSYTAEVNLGGRVDKAQPLRSLNFDRPPDNAVAAVTMRAGVTLVGGGNEVVPSAIGFPHAYPRLSKIPLDYDFVGFGQYGNSVVVCTTGRPYIIMGDDPEQLRAEKLDLDQACASRGSIVSMEGQVLYASREGIYSVGRSGIQHLTAGITDLTSWQELKPETFKAYNWDGKYLCFFEGEGEARAFMLDPSQLQQGLTFYRQTATAGFSTITEPGLYFLEGGVVYEWEGGVSTRGWTWGSRFTRRSKDGNPGRIKVQASRYPVTLSLWADDNHQVCKEWVIPDDNPQALPSGYLGEEFFVRLKGTGDLISVEFGDSIYDIQGM